jgi:hypothetical protein
MDLTLNHCSPFSNVNLMDPIFVLDDNLFVPGNVLFQYGAH